MQSTSHTSQSGFGFEKYIIANINISIYINSNYIIANMDFNIHSNYIIANINIFISYYLGSNEDRSSSVKATEEEFRYGPDVTSLPRL